MGVYYKIACDEVKESIEPGDINDLGIKLNAISAPDHPFGAVCVFAMARRWACRPCRIVDDCGDDPGYFDYADVTEEVIKAYNEVYRDGEPIRYTQYIGRGDK